MASAPTAEPHPTHKGANKNPAKIVLDQQTKWGTAAEVKADLAKAQEEATTAAAKAKVDLQEKIQSTAAIKDHIRKNAVESAKHAAHPNRQPTKKGLSLRPTPVKKTGVGHAPKKAVKKRCFFHLYFIQSIRQVYSQVILDSADEHEGGDDVIESMDLYDEGAEAFPPGVDTESDRMLIDTEEGENANEQDNIEPYILEEDCAPGVSDGNESGGKDVSTIPKITLKPGKKSQKARKSSVTTDGLPSDWKKHIITQTKLSHAGKTAPPAEESFKPGEFDEDKDAEQLAAVKQSKHLVKIGLKPMRDIHTYTTQWRKEFKPTTINFAASLPQPFSANVLLHNHIEQWWNLVFTFPMDEHWIWTTNSEDSLPAVVDQTSKVITEWRSSMGVRATLRHKDILGHHYK
ncbi:hypothetical protein H0H81_000596 [Sphagnurus paluster]|uniref:Uncharacterized protein n=1 Tax=Sphagnurus paluster TaxID=117069 RepID=A0A9P7FU10_9AGAR|nr:hypothetical protein H0H81_000596 [Sphagnurus paluster]